MNDNWIYTRVDASFRNFQPGGPGDAIEDKFAGSGVIPIIMKVLAGIAESLLAILANMGPG